VGQSLEAETCSGRGEQGQGGGVATLRVWGQGREQSSWLLPAVAVPWLSPG